MTRRQVIVGVGSPHGWDSLGWQVIDELAQRDLGAKLIKCEASGLDWIEQVRPADQLTFVDALIGPGTPGAVQRFVLTAEHLSPDQTDVSSHGFGLQYSLRLGYALRKLPAEFTLYGALPALHSPTDIELHNSACRIADTIAAAIDLY